MRRPILYLFTICFIYSCSSGDQKNGSEKFVKAADSAAVPRFKTLDTTLFFAGLWVNEKYVNDLKKTKSPRSLQDIDESCITLPDSTLKATSMVSGFHEGGEELVVVKEGDNYALYDAALKNLRKPIEIITGEKIKIGDNFFIKLRHPDNKKQDENILAELLFSGNYQLATGKTVKFTVDGVVSGLDSFNYYSPVIDYIGEGMDVDQVQLGAVKDDLESFGFKFKKDSLLIFQLNCLQYDTANKTCDSVGLGEIRYRLSRLH